MTIQKQIILWTTIFICLCPPDAIEAQQEDILVKIVRANEYYHEKDYQSAVEIFENLIAQGQNNGYLYYNLGNALASSGRYDKALRIYNAFLERSPATSGVLNGRAAAYIGLGRFDEATKDLREAVTQFGDHPITSANLRRLTPA